MNIADFMGYRLVDCRIGTSNGVVTKGYLVGYSSTPYTADGVKSMCMTSWDWLMPVIEKIERLGYSFEKNYQSIDKDWQILIVKGNDILFQEFNVNSLKATYNAVVNFIKWYNEKNKL